ncbi:CDP-diacylglycerol--glycerol-3-phosphate 3-phosphatidyltransferase [Desulfoluna butyratoxydans]|uniref:CDP-diacylglycerol--glycerol-3-phosphate 3-phosphatidyltransferase n=1 Tax=Desulfoluna butyratoxydans TaxID=231438 RepID=A0A4U8YV57_9BACT|nr:CDP-diacylglycerol--glycerol-3-phosphate 3-phosphatidyltransferase [Desulfoluna butyratoxydans]VFQ47319.1 cdp-diacylglycerol--glycerol-3-phosphate 3-phosphatidyltransferase [Desulfoluna butyratoxydans]
MINTIKHPNNLTLLRMASVPLIVILLLFSGSRFATILAALIFSAASITDYLDGFLARKWGLESTFGKVMDPLADKLLVGCSLIMMSSIGWIPGWVVCVIIGRELAITGLRSIIAEGGEDVSASKLGKYKTGFQIAAIIPLLIHFSYFGINFHGIGMFFLWCALILTIWSGADYFFRFRKLLTM